MPLRVLMRLPGLMFWHCTRRLRVLMRVLGPMSWHACNTSAQPCTLGTHANMRRGVGFPRRGVGASEPKKITSPGLCLRVSFYESQEQHRVQGGVVAGLERDMLQPW